MTSKSYKWTLFGVVALALCAGLLRMSLAHEAVTQELHDKAKVREGQIQTISTFEELAKRVRTLRDHEGTERKRIEQVLSFAKSRGLSKQLCESFEMPTGGYSLFTRHDSGSGHFLRGDADTKVIAYVRTSPPAPSKRQSQRSRAPLLQTLESPDSFVVVPAAVHQLTSYEIETAGPSGELALGIRITSRDIDQFIPLCNVEDEYRWSGADGPFNVGLFKSREYEITYGWPDLADIGFVEVLQKRRIWLIAANEFYRPANAPRPPSTTVQVVLALVSGDQWMLHPDYSYCRKLESAFSLKWDPQNQSYYATSIRQN